MTQSPTPYRGVLDGGVVERARIPVRTPLVRPTWWSLASAAGALLVFLAGTMYAATLVPGFTLTGDAISDLGAADSPARGVFGVTLVLVGSLLSIASVGLRPADTVGRWMLFAAGIAMVVLALVPNNVMGRFTLRHVLFSEFTLVLLALWPAFSGRHGRVAWPIRRRVGVIVSIVLFVLIQVTLWSIVLKVTGGGLTEFAAYLAAIGWPCAVALWTRLGGPGTATVLVDDDLDGRESEAQD